MKQNSLLNDEELRHINGGGVLGSLVGGTVGLLVGIPVGMTAYTIGRFTGTVSTSEYKSVMRDSMMASAGIGMSIGALSPTP